jgi:Protein of unknown function (DUF3810)
MRIFNKKITSVSGKPLQGSFRLHYRSFIWIFLAVATLLLQRWVPSGFWEKWYYEGLFGWIRQSYDFLLGWFPLPMIYIVLSVILVRTARWIGAWEKGLTFQLSKALGGLAVLIVLFYALWGFNYKQVSLQDKLGFNLGNVTQEDVRLEFLRATAVLRNEAEHLQDGFTNDEVISGLPVTDNDLRPDVETALAELQLPHEGRVRVRQPWPKGFLLRWNTAGIYIPQTGEGHIDKGLLSVQKPFTIAHEMAHGYGVTDEGACNFIAWLACSKSTDPWVRFGGAFTYWRYTAAEMPSDSVALVMHTFPPVVPRALTLIKENDKRYPDLLPQIRDAIYSSYLKRHGVKGGLRSYNYVVMMVQQYLDSKSTGAVPE